MGAYPPHTADRVPIAPRLRPYVQQRKTCRRTSSFTSRLAFRLIDHARSERHRRDTLGVGYQSHSLLLGFDGVAPQRH